MKSYKRNNMKLLALEVVTNMKTKCYTVEFKTLDGMHIRTLQVEAFNKLHAIQLAQKELVAILIAEVKES